MMREFIMHSNSKNLFFVSLIITVLLGTNNINVGTFTSTAGSTWFTDLKKGKDYYWNAQTAELRDLLTKERYNDYTLPHSRLLFFLRW